MSEQPSAATLERAKAIIDTAMPDKIVCQPGALLVDVTDWKAAISKAVVKALAAERAAGVRETWEAAALELDMMAASAMIWLQQKAIELRARAAARSPGDARD